MRMDILGSRCFLPHISQMSHVPWLAPRTSCWRGLLDSSSYSAATTTGHSGKERQNLDASSHIVVPSFPTPTARRSPDDISPVSVAAHTVMEMRRGNWAGQCSEAAIDDRTRDVSQNKACFVKTCRYHG